jgi:hypothetical protein
MSMNSHRLNDLIRSLRGKPSRRDLVAGLGGGVFGLRLTQLPHATNAKRKRRRKKGKTPKRDGTVNEFGCVNVGDVCTSHEQCCSGICLGKKGQAATCRQHDQGTCQAGQDMCGRGDATCTTGDGRPGKCTRTTGNGSFCYDGEGQCFTCARDADCVPLCGPRAACIVCDLFCGETKGTACVGLAGSCTFPEA